MRTRRVLVEVAQWSEIIQTRVGNIQIIPKESFTNAPIGGWSVGIDFRGSRQVRMGGLETCEFRSGAFFLTNALLNILIAMIIKF